MATDSGGWSLAEPRVKAGRAMRPCLCEGRAEMGVIAACLGVAMRGGGAWLRGGAKPGGGAGRDREGRQWLRRFFFRNPDMDLQAHCL